MIEDKVVKIFSDHVDSDVFIDSKISDFAIDSLDAVEIIMDLEEEFDISLPDDIAMSFETLQDIVNYVEENK